MGHEVESTYYILKNFKTTTSTGSGASSADITRIDNKNASQDAAIQEISDRINVTNTDIDNIN